VWMIQVVVAPGESVMCLCVGLSGAVDILVHHGAPLPPDIEYFTGCLAFIVEAVLFKSVICLYSARWRHN